jgi:hypothetical protein
MVHKLRAAMGKRDGEYVLSGRIELDESFFSTVTPPEKRDELLKRGNGSQRKTKVLVMAESEIVESPTKGAKPRRVGYLKMRVKIGEVLPWVHIAISNAKRQLLSTYHDIKPEFLQKYLDEFCYKFNRRYAGEALFARLLFACANYKNEFRCACGLSYNILTTTNQ